MIRRKHLKVYNTDLSCTTMEAVEGNVVAKETLIMASPNASYTKVEVKKGVVLATRSDVVHNCPYCSYFSKKTTHLQEHIATHTKEKPHKCPTCEKGFTLKVNMQRHLLIHSRPTESKLVFATKSKGPRGPTKPKVLHRCEECEYSTYKAHHLKEHILAKHTTERPFKCGVCYRAFALKVNLQRHLRVHSEEHQKKRQESAAQRSIRPKKVYGCELCPYIAKQNCHLQEHMRKHTHEKPFECTICGLSFALKVNMLRHMNSHVRTPMRLRKKPPGESPSSAYNAGESGPEEEELEEAPSIQVLNR